MKNVSYTFTIILVNKLFNKSFCMVMDDGSGNGSNTITGVGMPGF